MVFLCLSHSQCQKNTLSIFDIYLVGKLQVDFQDVTFMISRDSFC